MIRPSELQEAIRLREGLERFEIEFETLSGLNERTREVFVAQLIESQRRVRFRHHLRNTSYSFDLDSPNFYFDPLKGAVVSMRDGNFDEACWLVFLAVHFGSDARHGWALSGAFYTQLGQGGKWTWCEISRDPEAAISWLEVNEGALRSLGAKFGNHRKYQSLSARSSRGTGAVLSSYVDWVDNSHARRLLIGDSAKDRFAKLYTSLATVVGFGRLACFDYLTLLGDLGLVEIEANALYLSGSTGPLAGARLLLSGPSRANLGPLELETRLAPLSSLLGLPFNVLEDALCNWQKSPNRFLAFGC